MEDTMADKTKRGEAKPAKPIEQKKSGTELNEQELEKISGGACATGKHIPKGVIIT
jgi:bacteriocin-like protein